MSAVGEASDGLAIVIPTYNEKPNIRPLLDEFAALRSSGVRPFRIVLVDDSSPDGTAEAARVQGERLGLSVTVLSRPPPRSLGSAIAHGIAQTHADIVCVMDADLSHPPSLLPAMLDRLDGFDGVVASRYSPGGQVANWPTHRRVISYVATGLARSFTKGGCADPLSGYFLIRKNAINAIRITGRGNKPLLEILSQSNLRMQDLPYQFRDRLNGKSKLSVRGILEFVRLLGSLAFRKRRPDFELSDEIDGSGLEPRGS